MSQITKHPKERLDGMLGVIGPHTKMNYEDLKQALKLEDYFYEHILLPTAKEHGFYISFNGKYIHFDKKGDDV